MCILQYLALWTKALFMEKFSVLEGLSELYQRRHLKLNFEAPEPAQSLKHNKKTKLHVHLALLKLQLRFM